MTVGAALRAASRALDRRRRKRRDGTRQPCAAPARASRCHVCRSWLAVRVAPDFDSDRSRFYAGGENQQPKPLDVGIPEIEFFSTRVGSDGVDCCVSKFWSFFSDPRIVEARVEALRLCQHSVSKRSEIRASEFTRERQAR